MKTARLLLMATLLALVVSSFGDVISADAAITAATKQAKAEKKNVMVIFHASWCHWCHELDKFMKDPKFKPMFDKSFVVVHITVLENDDKKADENPGGMELMTKLKGDKAGLPFFAILDDSGKPIVASLRPVEGKDPENIGFPATEQEVGYFVTMLKKGAPKMTDADRQSISDFLLKKQ